MKTGKYTDFLPQLRGKARKAFARCYGFPEQKFADHLDRWYGKSGEQTIGDWFDRQGAVHAMYSLPLADEFTKEEATEHIRAVDERSMPVVSTSVRSIFFCLPTTAAVYVTSLCD